MRGGKLVRKTSRNTMSHPPGSALHVSDTRPSHSKTRCEKIQPTMSTTHPMATAATASTRCPVVRPSHVRIMCSFRRSAASQARRTVDMAPAPAPPGPPVGSDTETDRNRAVDRRRWFVVWWASLLSLSLSLSSSLSECRSSRNGGGDGDADTDSPSAVVW